MIKIYNKQAGISLLEVTIASTLFMLMMGVTLTLTMNIQDVTKTEIDRSHLQSQLQDVVDKIVADIRESKWRWSYVANESNGKIAPNSFFLYPSGRNKNGIFQFNTSGDDKGFTNWQAMNLLVALPSDAANRNASGVTRYDLWKFTDFRGSIIPLVSDKIGKAREPKKDETIKDMIKEALQPNLHGDIVVDETNEEIFIRNSLGTTLITFNKNGTVNANQRAQKLMTNVTRFFINAEIDGKGALTLPKDTDNTAKYRFPFSLDMEVFYVSTNVRVSLSTAVLAENKNNL